MYVYIYEYIYIYIHIYIYRRGLLRLGGLDRLLGALGSLWLRTNGVNTNGAAAEVIDSDRLGKKVRPGTLGKIKLG